MAPRAAQRQQPAIAPHVQEQAAVWLVELQAQPDDASLRQQWQAWRAQDPLHEQAWQQIEAMGSRLASLPAPLVQGTLERAAQDDKERKGSRRGAVKTLLVMMGVGTTTWLLHDQADWQPVLADARTGIGQRQTLALDDGSTLELNTDTAVRIRFSATERRIRLLQGEILLQTGPGPAYTADLGTRPLLVETRHGRATALGTRFTVRQADGQQTEVQVFEGRVRIHPKDLKEGDAAPILQPGQAMRFTAQHTQPVQTASEQALAWRSGMLIVQDMPLATFINELARYHHGTLESDASVAGLTVTGTFPTRDTQQVLRMLASTLPVQVETRQRLLGASRTLVRAREGRRR